MEGFRRVMQSQRLPEIFAGMLETTGSCTRGREISDGSNCVFTCGMNATVTACKLPYTTQLDTQTLFT